MKNTLKLRFLHWKFIGKYRNFFYKEFILFYSDMWKAYKKKLNLENAKKRARAWNKADGRTYYVLPDYDGKYTALNSDMIKNLQHRKIMSKQVNGFYLFKEAAYIVRGEKNREIIDRTKIWQKETIFSK